MADGGGFDFKAPDYRPIFAERLERLTWLRAEPHRMEMVKRYYRENPAQFIDDWGVTVDPRNADIDAPSIMPFKLFPRQWEFIDFVMRKWGERRPGLVEKSRELGVSWLCVSLAATLCIFRPGISIGFGSRKEEYVDNSDDPKSLFWKARAFIKHLPPEFRGGWNERFNSAHMRITFPETESSMNGEAGDNIGRGDRKAIYFVDEAAHLAHPKAVDASLSNTTNCRIDVSSVNGMANSFAIKRHSGKIEVFIFDWREDPRKDEAWYRKQEEELDPVILAQEVDRDYLASVEGVVIPGAWAKAAIDAHVKLGIAPTGHKAGALDIADEGPDRNAFCGATGWLIEHIEEWSGKGSDTFASVQKAFQICEDRGYREFKYDADGIGATARGDARIINERLAEQRRPQIEVIAFRGSGEVYLPEGEDIKGRKNKDYFANRKAQGWWGLRTRFRNTYRWVAEGVPCAPDDIISISSTLKDPMSLVAELSQATYSINGVGKIVIDKAPDGAKSPNKADAVMMRMSQVRTAMRIDQGVLRQAMRR